ncbi:MAG: HRDC domain-containing protein, partial [Frankia sp.]
RKSRRPSRFLDGIRPAPPAGSGPGADGAACRSRSRAAVRCRVCGIELSGAGARLGRCESCPSDLDEALFDKLRTWRSARAKVQKVPAYVVFSDATLVALAERRPVKVSELVAVPGIGQTKLDRYGEDVLALMRGEAVVVTDGGPAL